MEDGGQQCRGKDLASTYVLHPCWRTRLLERLIYYMARSNTVNGVVWRM